MNRKEFIGKTMRAAYERCHVDGVPRCEGMVPSTLEPNTRRRCSADLRSRPFHYDHDDADYFSKDNSLSNCVVLCVPCHKDKTNKIDTPKIAKSRRIYKARSKTKRKSRPIPGTRASGVRIRMNGNVERW